MKLALCAVLSLVLAASGKKVSDTFLPLVAGFEALKGMVERDPRMFYPRGVGGERACPPARSRAARARAIRCRQMPGLRRFSA